MKMVGPASPSRGSVHSASMVNQDGHIEVRHLREMLTALNVPVSCLKMWAYGNCFGQYTPMIAIYRTGGQWGLSNGFGGINRRWLYIFIDYQECSAKIIGSLECLCVTGSARTKADHCEILVTASGAAVKDPCGFNFRHVNGEHSRIRQHLECLAGPGNKEHPGINMIRALGNKMGTS